MCDWGGGPNQLYNYVGRRNKVECPFVSAEACAMGGGCLFHGGT
jgi:hypothetical protein